MKRLQRDNPSIDQVRLLAAFSKKSGIAEYTEDALKAFASETTRELTTIVGHDARLSGLRAEAVFLAVVAGIGKVRLIKSEDDGELYYEGADVRSPDFRIILDGGSPLLVEVKAPHMEDFHDRLKLGDTYVQQLRRYAEIMKTELRFAIFWSGARTWTLNRLEAFEAGLHGERQWSIDFARAYETSEMAILGDKFIATPAPLVFRIHVDPEKSDPIPASDGPMGIMLRRIELLSRDRPLSGKAAAIAWKLLWHGTWIEESQHIEKDGDRMVWIDHLFGPPKEEESEDCGPGCVMIGSLSRIITSAYLSGAERTVHTTSNSGVLEPGFMGQFIPEDFMQLELPLALMTVKSNLEIEEGSLA